MAFNLGNFLQGAASKASSLVSPSALGRIGETLKGGLSGKAKAAVGIAAGLGGILGNPKEALADRLKSTAQTVATFVDPTGLVDFLTNAPSVGESPERIAEAKRMFAEQSKPKVSPQPQIGKQYGPPAPVAVSPAALENIAQSTIRKPTASVPQVTKPSVARTATPPAPAMKAPIQSTAQGITTVSPQSLMRSIPDAPQTQVPSVTSPTPQIKPGAPSFAPLSASRPPVNAPVASGSIKTPSAPQTPSVSPITGFTPSPSPSMGALVSLPSILKALAERGDVLPPAGNVAMPENMPLAGVPIRRKKFGMFN